MPSGDKNTHIEKQTAPSFQERNVQTPSLGIKSPHRPSGKTAHFVRIRTEYARSFRYYDIKRGKSHGPILSLKTERGGCAPTAPTW